MQILNEVTRWEMIRAAQSQSPDRFDKRRHYRAMDFDNVDFKALFEDDEFLWASRVGDYVVTINFLGAFDALKYRLKSLRGKNRWKRITLKDVVETLSNSLDREDLYVRCTCPDFQYRFGYWATQADCIYGTPENRAPTVRNVNNNKGFVCKHVLSVLYGKRWVVAASKAWLAFMRANPEITEWYIWGKKLEDEQPATEQQPTQEPQTNNQQQEPTDDLEKQLDNDPDFNEEE